MIFIKNITLLFLAAVTFIVYIAFLPRFALAADNTIIARWSAENPGVGEYLNPGGGNSCVLYKDGAEVPYINAAYSSYSTYAMYFMSDYNFDNGDYTFDVLDSNGQTLARSDIYHYVKPAESLPDPNNLILRTNAAGEAFAMWDPVAGAIGYTIYFYDDSNNQFASIPCYSGFDSVINCSWILGGRDPSKITFRVRAWSGNMSKYTCSPCVEASKYVTTNEPSTITYAAAFPDKNFRNEVLNLIGGGKTDSSPITYEDKAILQQAYSLNINGKNITDVTGIEYFTELTSLICDNNQINALDLSRNTHLRSISASNNPLTAIDVSNDTILNNVTLNTDKLTELDLTHNSALTVLWCTGNQLLNLNFSNNVMLQEIYCGNNQITDLNVKNSPILSKLWCQNNNLSKLDVTNNPNLIELWCNDNQITALSVISNNMLTLLSCANNKITELDLTKNIQLTSLFCHINQLNQLDVTKNAALQSINCSDNQITNLDVSNNPALTTLLCYNNRLTELDISKNPLLDTLNCTYNIMESPDNVMNWRDHWAEAGTDNGSDDNPFLFYPQNTAQQTFTISGIIQSYNPKNQITLTLLLPDGQEKYKTSLPSYNGQGQVEQNFAIPDVEPGTYTLKITKPAHTSYTINNIVVADKDVDLTLDPRPQVKLISMLCGDINNDGVINVNDLNTIWSNMNYGKSVEAAQNSLCDLNGDGVINVNDLNILWSSVNYGKGVIVIN